MYTEALLKIIFIIYTNDKTPRPIKSRRPLQQYSPGDYE